MTIENETPAVLVGAAAASAAKLKKIALKDRTPEQAKIVREYERENQKKKAAKSAAQADSETEISKKDAKAVLLDERKVQNEPLPTPSWSWPK
jgi:hypothetical protein